MKVVKTEKSEILSSYQEESALPEGRAEGEFQRTISQIQSFIELMDNGSFSKVKIAINHPNSIKNTPESIETELESIETE